ncbi:Calcium-activated potassium channel slo-1 [Hypsibius exemplaris]|uniref:BK channel n=1 Tax=Hypsibius exemplaris TaxID=2072580 RepID=A0A1W0X2B9_HYPEX|nr:Calcium-activated potassium channel slo-1 [Hypsibius exemplaris]
MANKLLDNLLVIIDGSVGEGWRYIVNLGHINHTDYYQSCEQLGRGREWKLFFFSSVLCPIVLYFILAIWTLIKWSLLRSKRVIIGQPHHVKLPESVFGKARAVAVASEMSLPWSDRLQQEANKIACGQNVIGRIVGIVGFVAAMTSFGIYVHDVSDVVPDLEVCRSWLVTLEWQIDFGCNLFFLFYFFLRLLASNRKVWFLSELYTLVDYATIPTAFICFIRNRNWSGFRFLRILYIFWIPEVLQCFGLIKNRNEARLSQLVCHLAGVVLVGAGVFHLIENFHVVLENGHSYWKFLYFTLITISTVGYGDIYPLSAWGRLFTCLFIMAALGLFASSIPDIAGMVGTRYKYGGKFKLESGSHHIIVCGHITHGIAKQIMDNCFHNDHEVKNLSVVFISDDDPDLEMEALLKMNFTQVIYLQGDVLNNRDLERVAIKDAFACLIIADRSPERENSEDALNIMRVISIKNVHPTTRVIVQLLHRHNQTYLYNLPTWSAFRGDTVINVYAIRMTFLAMSCQAMGFSTLMSNLLRCYPVTQHRHAHSDLETETLNLYSAGFRAKLRVYRLSEFFVDLSFQEAARHCNSTMDLLLIGLFKRPYFHESGASGEFVINPASHSRITASHMGIFVALDSVSAERASVYCKSCHVGVRRPSEIKSCSCHSRLAVAVVDSEVDPVRKFWSRSQQVGKSRGPTTNPTSPIGQHNSSFRYSKASLPYMDNEKSEENPVPIAASISGYHQAPIRTISEARIESIEKDFRHLKNHIVVCILAEEGAAQLCLQQLIGPLRSSSIPHGSLLDIVLFGNVKFIEAEWSSLAQYPKIHVVQGNATEWKHLELASIRTCSVCVVLASKKSDHTVNAVQDDQQAVLATLNLRSVECGFRVANLACGLGRTNAHLDIITALDDDENVRFLEYRNLAEAETVSQTRSYMAGEILVNSVVDSLTIATYFNPLAISLIKSFVFGRSSFAQSVDQADIPRNNKEYLGQSCLNLVQIGDGVLDGITGGENFREVVRQVLDRGAVCLGIFRLFPDPAHGDETITSGRRCVITAPPPETVVQPDDLFFIFASTPHKRPSRVLTSASMHKFQLVDYNGLHEQNSYEGEFGKLMENVQEDLFKHRACLQAYKEANQKMIADPV